MKFDAKTIEKLLDSKFVSVVRDDSVPGVRVEKNKGSFWVLINECTVEPKFTRERIEKALQEHFQYTKNGNNQFQVTGRKSVVSK